MVKSNLYIDIAWVEDKFSGGARYSIENILKSIILNKKFSKFKIIFILNKNVLTKYKFLKKYNKIFLTNNKIINFIIRWFFTLKSTIYWKILWSKYSSHNRYGY